MKPLSSRYEGFKELQTEKGQENGCRDRGRMEKLRLREGVQDRPGRRLLPLGPQQDFVMAGQEPKILVIDDESGLRRMLSRVLPRYGFAVTTVPSGELGIEKIKAEHFDVVLCDVMMPGMGGVATLKAIKEIQPTLEVIIVTGFPTSETADECEKLGAFDFISKPYELDPLCEALFKALKSNRSKTRKSLIVGDQKQGV
jgi:CheY-like chemotaxis protein